MIFRKNKTRDEVQEWLATADPKEIAIEKAALEREDAEAHGGLAKPVLPTEIGTNLIDQSLFRGRFSPSLGRADNSFLLPRMPEVEEPERPRD